jgi:hypothetical protein
LEGGAEEWGEVFCGKEEEVACSAAGVSEEGVYGREREAYRRLE